MSSIEQFDVNDKNQQRCLTVEQSYNLQRALSILNGIGGPLNREDGLATELSIFFVFGRTIKTSSLVHGVFYNNPKHDIEFYSL